MKPSNLLLSPDGRVSINDFGLARMLEQPGMTTTGEFMGSPLYMSPEQITAGRAPLDHRTDIYSLGATLCELLTLQPPFLGERRDQGIAQVLHKEPVPPRRINRKIPTDLETICIKSMDKDPDRRYQTASQMAEDLRRFVNRFAISAKRVGMLGRAAKWVRRHRALSVTACFAVVVTLAATSCRKQVEPKSESCKSLSNHILTPPRRITTAVGLFSAARNSAGYGDGNFSESGNGFSPLLKLAGCDYPRTKNTGIE